MLSVAGVDRCAFEFELPAKRRGSRRAPAPNVESDDTRSLTWTEVEIISRLAEWQPVDSIISELGLNARLFASHKSKILGKLGLDDLTAVRLWASALTNKRLAELTGRTTKEAAAC